jgi:hypothetical protein
MLPLDPEIVPLTGGCPVAVIEIPIDVAPVALAVTETTA